jgi:hypothetical protein
MNAREADAARRFWQAFGELAPRLALAECADDPTYDALLERLQEVHPELWFEFGIDTKPDGNELIITAHGQRSLFPLVRELVDMGPVVERWSSIALKPQLGFPESVKWNDVTVEAANVFVRIHRRETGGYDLDLLVPDIDDVQREDAHNALLNMMDSGLGEERLAELVIGTDIFPLHPSDSIEGLVPLVELEEALSRAEAFTRR